jgi:DNA-directed RNA polymerase specialized sigma24 family protein
VSQLERQDFYAPKESWDELLSRAKTKDRQALNELIIQLTVTLRPILQSRLRGWSHEDKQDVMQETLVTFTQKLAEVKSNPHHFAAAILRHKIGDAMRRQRRGHADFVTLDDNSIAPDMRRQIELCLSQYGPGTTFVRRLEDAELLKHVIRALEELSDFCQTFFLGLMEQVDREELFQLLRRMDPSLRRGTFRKRIFDCRQRLKLLLQE